jgi:hypothetical protein
MDTLYFSTTTEDVDDPDEPTPDEGHTEEDDNDETDEVVPGDQLGDAPTGLGDGAS